MPELHQNTLLDTRGIAANRPSHFYVVPGQSGEPFDTSAERGGFWSTFQVLPNNPTAVPPQVLEKAEPEFVNSGAHKQMFLERRLPRLPLGRAGGRLNVQTLGNEDLEVKSRC